MKRSAFFLFGLILILVLILSRYRLFERFAQGSQGSSSSLNLIVRVSPLLNKEKTGSGNALRGVSSYRPYTPSVDLRGQSTLLFFAKSDDAFSDSHDIFLRGFAASGKLQILTYRVDFDSAAGMKLKYGVIVPDTFVLLDAASRKVQSLLHPSDEELHSLLSSAPR